MPKDWHEWRRGRALAMKREGWLQQDIAKALDVVPETVSRWLGRARQEGPQALHTHWRSGRPARLTAEQRRLIAEFLWHGAEAYGFRGEVRTCGRIAPVIAEELGVVYHPAHVGRLLRQLGWSPQVPVRRALQRDEAAIAAWRRETWPALRSQARRERRTLVFVDEAGFYLLPGVVRTYAPVACPPVRHEHLSRDHLSVMGGLTPAGKVYSLVRAEPLTGLHSVEFLLHLQRLAGPRLLVIGDGSPIHRRAEVKEFVAGTRGRVWLEALPGYAPDLNPWDEGGWHHLKHVEMANLVCLDLEELHEEFHLALGRLRQKPHLARSFYAQAGLSLTADTT